MTPKKVDRENKIVIFENDRHQNLTIQNNKIIGSTGFIEPSEMKKAYKIYNSIFLQRFSGDATPLELEREKQESLF